jgi:DNA-binding NtrC family response regulator
MSDRRVLCIDASGIASGLPRHLAAFDWVVEVVTDFMAAELSLQQRPAPVGLIVAPSLAARDCSRLDGWLQRQGSMVWVGAFDTNSIATPACRELIVNHLFDHHTLPIDAQRLSLTLGHALGHAALLRSVPPSHDHERDSELVGGRSEASRELSSQIRRVARVDAPVLLVGESGSGKELAAQLIHRLSSRAAMPFVPVNCGAIPATLIQSELFGYERGAFTGAVREKHGFIEAASGGTLFLDEIGDLPRELQTNLLRFLQEGTINRVGSIRPIRVDARVVAATHVDLDHAVAQGSFREDLFYRLNVLSLRVPPLRERVEDIDLLAERFFEKFSAEKNPRLRGFSDRALAAMRAHAWPGNVRELINRVRRAMVMAQGRLITPADLGLDKGAAAQPFEALDEARMRAEQKAIALSLRNAGRNVSLAAKHLGVSRMTLYRLMAKHGMTDRGAMFAGEHRSTDDND